MNTSIEQVFTQNLLFWFRWLAVLPAGLIAVVLVAFPVHWLVILLHQTTEDSLRIWQLLDVETLEILIQATVAPYVFIRLGTKVAPSQRLHVAAVLCLLWALLLVIAAAFVLLNDSIGFPRPAVAGLALGLGLLGAISGGYSAQGPFASVPGRHITPNEPAKTPDDHRVAQSPVVAGPRGGGDGLSLEVRSILAAGVLASLVLLITAGLVVLTTERGHAPSTRSDIADEELGSSTAAALDAAASETAISAAEAAVSPVMIESPPSSMSQEGRRGVETAEANRITALREWSESVLGRPFAGQCNQTRQDRDIGKICYFKEGERQGIYAYIVGLTFSGSTAWAFLEYRGGHWTVIQVTLIPVPDPYAVPGTPWPLAEGETLVVAADDCLNSREAPTLAAPGNDCITPGTAVKLTAGPQRSDGMNWWRIESGSWVAEPYLRYPDALQ